MFGSSSFTVGDTGKHQAFTFGNTGNPQGIASNAFEHTDYSRAFTFGNTGNPQGIASNAFEHTDYRRAFTLPKDKEYETPFGPTMATTNFTPLLYSCFTGSFYDRLKKCKNKESVLSLYTVLLTDKQFNDFISIYGPMIDEFILLVLKAK